jgi:STE24 endopeptidase
MRGRDLLLGLAAGFSAGYLGARAYEAWCELRSPRPHVRERDAAAYGRVRRALEVAGTAQGICSAFALAYGAIGEQADRATLRAPSWARPALFVVPLALCGAAADLGATFVADYALERRYGLTEQTPEAWLGDYAKGVAVSTAMTAIAATLLGAAVRRAPRWWPFFATVGALPLIIAGNLIVPVYVLPLFNTFTPLQGALEERLRRLASRFGVGDADILTMDMSRQTSKANAFVVGVAQTHRIVLGDTLVDKFPDDEVEFVVAHELGHYVARDVWRLTAIADAMAGALFFIANTFCGPRSGMRDRPIVLARLYAAMLLATQVLRPLLFAFTRSREAAADRFAVDATNAPATGAAAFARLRDQNLAEDDVPRWYEIFFSSHPSLRSRITRLEAMQPDPSSV